MYLITRYFIESLESKGPEKPVNAPEKKDEVHNKKVSKKIGEYVDYEEMEE